MRLRQSGGVPAGHHEQPGAADAEIYPFTTKAVPKLFRFTLSALKMSLDELLTGWNDLSPGAAGEPASLQEVRQETHRKHTGHQHRIPDGQEANEGAELPHEGRNQRSRAERFAELGGFKDTRDQICPHSVSEIRENS